MEIEYGDVRRELKYFIPDGVACGDCFVDSALDRFVDSLFE